MEAINISIPLERMRKFVKGMEHLPDDTPIQFELLMTYFFPSIFENVKRYGSDCYTKGFITGINQKGEQNE